MDSRKIAQALEEQHPSPPLRLSSPYLPKLEALLPKIMPPLRGVYWPLVPARLLNPPSQAYWHQTRAKLAGMPLDQLQREQGGEPAWGKAEEFAKEVTAMLKEREDGPFFEGKEVGYADLLWAGHLLFVKRLGDDVFGELLKRTGDGGLHTGFLEAVGEWSKRNDH
jgi:glutathione S-transferase